jgi:hypothetical protein
MCAWISLVIGLALTRSGFFILLGLLWLAGTVLTVLLGFWYAIKYRERCDASRLKGEMHGMARRWPALLLLWLNFPFVYVAFGLGIALMRL